jgi:hypothetical protein
MSQTLLKREPQLQKQNSKCGEETSKRSSFELTALFCSVPFIQDG